MLEVYRKKLLIGLMALLVSFAIILIVTLLDLKRGVALLGTGIGYQIENTIVIVLALLSMLKVIQEIIKVEQ